MKIAIISDLHGTYPHTPELFDNDIELLLIGGDIIGGSLYNDLYRFQNWLSDINPKKCIATLGNHDPYELINMRDELNFKLLIDESYTYNGLKIYGTPWSLPFNNWFWMAEEETLKHYYNKIPNDLDILMSHGCMFGVCDTILEDDAYGSAGNLGSKELAKAIYDKNPKYVYTGHIHSADHNDNVLKNGTIVSCVSILNEKYKYTYKPKVIELSG